MTMKGQGERVTLSIVRDAFFRGDFEGCLALCDALRPRDARDGIEATLLRARCLIPLGRGEHALEALRGLRIADEQHDEYITSRVLLSAAYLSLGQHQRGLEIAREAYEDGRDSHPTVRAEATAQLGIAYYRNTEYARADRYLQAVSADADIVHAKAMLYRGYVAWARGDYNGSVQRFQDALRCIDACEHHDRFVQAETLYGLTFLAGELPRTDLWGDVRERIDRFDWSVSGVGVWRYWIAVEGSFVAELLGDLRASTTWARLAERLAPDEPSRIAAWCRLAARFGRYGEDGAHAYFVDKATEAYETMKRDPRRSEQRALPLAIADETVYGEEPVAAAPLLTYYAEAIIPTMKGHAEERRLDASHGMILGHFEERRGNRARAQEAYLRAFEGFRSVGFLRRAAIVAYRLLVLTGEDHYEAFITEALRDASPAYWVKARITKSRIEARLTPRQLEVLRLVAEGRSNKEIAAARGIAFHTARNTVSEILSLLGVESRAELAALAATRGLVRSGK